MIILILQLLVPSFLAYSPRHRPRYIRSLSAIKEPTPTLSSIVPKRRPHFLPDGSRDDYFHYRDDANDDTRDFMNNRESGAERLRAQLQSLTVNVTNEIVAAEETRVGVVGTQWLRLGRFEWSREEGSEFPCYYRRSLGSIEQGAILALNESAVPAAFLSAYPGGPATKGYAKGVSWLEPEPQEGELLAYTVDLEGNEVYAVAVSEVYAFKKYSSTEGYLTPG